jgi:hypothetical protein
MLEEAGAETGVRLRTYDEQSFRPRLREELPTIHELVWFADKARFGAPNRWPASLATVVGCARDLISALALSAVARLRNNPIKDVSAELTEGDDSFFEHRLIESFEVKAFA